MYNTKMILDTGEEVYPGYLTKEKRESIKQKYKDKKEYMKCGCKPHENLYYRISEDLKIYPEHNNYVHDLYCSRYKDEDGKRKTAYVINEEDGIVTAYCTFNPKDFKQSEKKDEVFDEEPMEEITDPDSEELVIDPDTEQQTIKEEKEPKLSLPELIRSINVDSYTERILNGQKILNAEQFSKYVYKRMSKIKIGKLRKSIGEMTLEQDGVKFIYLPFVDAVKKTEKGITKSYVKTAGKDGKSYYNFIFPETLERAVKKYKKEYGIKPNQHTMIAGFQYLQKGKSKYRVLGRIHLFQITDIGLFARNISELNTLNDLQYIAESDHNITYWIPPEDPNIEAVIKVADYEKKILLMHKGKKANRITVDTSMYVPLATSSEVPLSAELIYALLNKDTSKAAEDSEESYLDLFD